MTMPPSGKEQAGGSCLPEMTCRPEVTKPQIFTHKETNKQRNFAYGEAIRQFLRT